MTTLSILIGNSDDKLKQSEWSEFIQSVQQVVAHLDLTVHFHGFSHPEAPWQNACWVVETEGPSNVLALKGHLRMVAWAYHQDSIALVHGETEFIQPGDRNA